MILFLTLIYCALLIGLVKLKILPWNTATKLSPAIVLIALLVFLFIPLQWSAPAGDIRVLRYTVEVVPNVSGEVIDVPVEANTPLQEGDILFKIDPAPFEAKVDQVKAQLDFQKTRLSQFTQLARADAGTRFQVEQTAAQVAQLEAQLDEANYNLEQTVVRAPSKGIATNVALRPGQRVANLPLRPALSFINTSETLLVAQVHQIYARHIMPGLPAEATFKFFPGKTFSANVDYMLPANSQGQPVTGGTLPAIQSTVPDPFFVRISLDDQEAANSLPAGSIGGVAIYSPKLTMAHIIRKVMIRMDAWLNYIVPD